MIGASRFSPFVSLPPHSDFNPVLLKPTTDQTAQIIIDGQVALDLDDHDHRTYKPRATGPVLFRSVANSLEESV